MPRRELSKKSKYWLPAEEYATAYHYARRYPLLEAELKTIGSIQGLSYEGEAVQTSSCGDPTEAAGIRRAEISRKMEVVQTAAAEAAPDIAEFLMLGVAYGLTFYQLAERGIPCGKNYYYEHRRKFYWLLAKKI